MANKINYQKLMEDLIKENCMDNNCTPRLLLHSCCGPCSTYCIQTLSEYFDVTVFYYNPNIYPPEEYHMRVQEQKRFIDEFPVKNPVHFVEGVYDTRRFYDMARGMEAVPEGGERCSFMSPLPDLGLNTNKSFFFIYLSSSAIADNFLSLWLTPDLPIGGSR